MNKIASKDVMSILTKSHIIRNFTLSSVDSFCDKSYKITESPLKRLVENSSSFQDIHPATKEQQWATLPYPRDAKLHKHDDNRKPKVDPRETSFILFPGQGTQYVGMARNLLKFPKARDLFELSNYILGYDLLKLCLEGPKSDLDQTKYCQPSVMVCSLAAIEQLKEERPQAIENCVATAGFSLGEITALVFAGALGFERGIQYNSDLNLFVYFIVINRDLTLIVTLCSSLAEPKMYIFLVAFTYSILFR